MDPVYKMVVVFGLCLLLTSAASHKVLNRSVFYNQLSAYGLLPLPMLGLAVLVLPLVELSLATALLIPFLRDFALVGAALLLDFYAAIMLISILRGRRNIDCGCGGSEGATPISYGHVARNLLLSGLALWMTGATAARSLSFADWLLIALMTLAFAACYEAANQLMANRPLLKHYKEA